MPDTSELLLKVIGMNDNRCREHVIAALRTVEGVQQVSVNLVRAEAVIRYRSPCEEKQLIGALFQAGYGITVDGVSPPDAA